MNLLGWIVALPALLLLHAPLVAAPKQTVIVVSGPTVVAFFAPATDAELSKDPDTSGALGDFQDYASRVRDRLHSAGVNFEEIYAAAFRVKRGTKTTTFHPHEAVGYYFIEPDKAPRVEYGVLTDVDIFQIATEYFPLVSK